MTVLAFQKPVDSDDLFADPDPVRQKEMRRLYRTLRTFTRMAQQQHFCDWCCRYIEGGDRYKGTVQIFNGKLVVWKQHDDPPCPVDPWQEEQQILRDIEKEVEKEKQPKTEAA